MWVGLNTASGVGCLPQLYIKLVLLLFHNKSLPVVWWWKVREWIVVGRLFEVEMSLLDMC